MISLLDKYENANFVLTFRRVTILTLQERSQYYKDTTAQRNAIKHLKMEFLLGAKKRYRIINSDCISIKINIIFMKLKQLCRPKLL